MASHSVLITTHTSQERHFSMGGYVYIFSNPAFPDLLKVGYTTDAGTRKRTPTTSAQNAFRPSIGHVVHDRARQLSDPTGVPEPFEVRFYMQVDSPYEFETRVHAALKHGQKKRYWGDKRPREFFRLPIEEIRETIAFLAGDQFCHPARFQLEETKSPLHKEMEMIWKHDRNTFWKEVRHLNEKAYHWDIEKVPDADSGKKHGDKPDDPSLPLYPNASIHTNYVRLYELVRSRGCYVSPHFCDHPAPYTTAHLDLYSKTGLCFAIFDLPIVRRTTGWDQHNIDVLPHSYARNYLAKLTKLCDALVRCEREIYQRAVARTITMSDMTDSMSPKLR